MALDGMRRGSYERLMRLKCLARTGWMQRGVPAALAETVAAHSFEAAVLAFLLASSTPGLRAKRHEASLLALLHDAAEALAGDIPRWSALRLGEAKESLEEEALRELGLAGILGSPDEALRIIVKAADLLATALQARRYVDQGYRDTREIYLSSKEAFCRLVEERGLHDARRLAEELLGEGC